MLCTERKRGLKATVFASAILFLLAAALVMLPGCGSTPDTPGPDGTDPNAPIEEVVTIRNAKVGDIVTFGSYEWRVLANEGDKALLITAEVIDQRPFNTEDVAITWENCTLRDYLNGEFLDGFDDGQKAAIAETTVTNPGNPKWGTPVGNDTTDKIFLLSVEEADKYFNSEDDQGGFYQGSESAWWLRNPGAMTDSAAFVYITGGLCDDGANVTGPTGVRPAMWVNL